MTIEERRREERWEGNRSLDATSEGGDEARSTAK